MSRSDALTLEEVDARLDVLSHNLDALYHAASDLASERPDDSLAFMSLAQAFADEASNLKAMRAGEPHDRYRALTDALANLSTIRTEADADAIAVIDERVVGSLQKWG